MKKVFIPLIVALFSSLYIYSQDILYLKNGNQIKGVLNSFEGGKIVFDNAETGDLKTYRGKNIEKIITKRKDSSIIDYAFRDLNGISSVLSGELVSGQVSLYVVNRRIVGSGVWSFMYLNKEGEKNVTKVSRHSLTTPFYRKMAKYFSKCPKLSKRIKGKQHHYADLEEIVMKYNDCVK